MYSSAKYQMDFLEKLAFNRYGGTEDERKAAELISEEVKRLGGSSQIEEFTIPGCSVSKATLEVIEPFHRTLEVNAVGRTGSTGGLLEADLFYAEGGEEENFQGAEGKIVLLNTTAPKVYERLMRSGALAFIVYSGAYQDDPEKTDLDKRLLRPELTDKYGTIPGVCLRTADAISLLKDGAKRLRLEVEGTSEDHISRNVVAVLPGEEPDKELLFTAHYDSTIYGLGAWDNASGSVNLLELYRTYRNQKHRYTLRFIWCGSEEQGLLGSRAYVEAHKEELSKILLCLNFDMTGTLVGSHRLMVTGNSEIDHYIKFLAKEIGFITKFCDDVHHSDSAPFANEGIPAIGFMRDGQAGGHSRFDIPWPLSGEQLAAATDYAKALIHRIDSARTFPFNRTIDPKMAETVANYIHPKD